ncbi:MAG TPA: CBS domain-containing protein [Noviherbaspirillum sp.]
MQMVSELMTRDVRFVAPQESLQRAAQMMDELNVGALPVCDDGRLVGMVTDRDITIRATAAGRSPQEAHVDEVMSTDVRWCFEDQPLDDVMTQMADSQIRRIPVVSHDDEHKLVGIVSLGDVAAKTPGGEQKAEVGQVMETVSSPSEPGRQASGSDAAGGNRGTSAGAQGGTGDASRNASAGTGGREQTQDEPPV